MNSHSQATPPFKWLSTALSSDRVERAISYYIAPHAHAAGVAVIGLDGVGVVHCTNDLMLCAFVHPPAASVAQDASGAGPPNTVLLTR